MIRIQKLKRPTKRSGFKLIPGKPTSVRGLVITNTNSFDVWVDKFTPKHKKKAKVRK